jgi:hypothetical protein
VRLHAHVLQRVLQLQQREGDHVWGLRRMTGNGSHVAPPEGASHVTSHPEGAQQNLVYAIISLLTLVLACCG